MIYWKVFRRQFSQEVNTYSRALTLKSIVDVIFVEY